ncbi:hypothetical protein DL98DRAFT_523366 [Cadophora sp. DSE1049]|nr:hypothetical protein DL98DRAFT_523366 [Cadophora sp. DSE1049]
MSTSSSCDDILIENMWSPVGREPMAYGTPSPFLNQPLNQPSLHAWERPLRISPPNGPMESMMVGIIQQKRSLVLCDTTGTALTGPYQPSLKPLCCPDLSNSTHPVLLILSNILRGLTYRSLPEKIGTLLVLYPVFQWQISHTFETYNNLPEWYRPQPSQLIAPHPIWITYIGWPKLRDIVIADQKIYATEEFQFLYTISANVNWPYPAADALTFEGGDVRASEAFARHVRQLTNWSLDKPFQSRYPELRDYCTFTEDRVPAQDLGSGSQR